MLVLNRDNTAERGIVAMTGTPVLDSIRSGSLTTFLSICIMNTNKAPSRAPARVANVIINCFLGVMTLLVLIGKSMIRAALTSPALTIFSCS